MRRYLKLLLLCSAFLWAQHAAPLHLQAQSDCGQNLRCGQVPWKLPLMPVLASPTPFATSVPEVVQPTSESALIPTPSYCLTPQPPAQATNYRQTVANTLPVAYWPLDETAGSTAGDAIGDRDGSYFGATLNGYTVAGGAAPSFDGINDRVSMANIGGVLNSGAFTVSLWMRVATNWAGSSTLAYLGSQALSITRSGGNIVLVSGSSSASASASSNGTNWVNVIAVINRPVMGGAGGRLYLNGASAATANAAPPWFSNNDTLYVASTAIGGWHAGGIAHVAVWNRALTSGEIALIANASPSSAPTPTPNPGCASVAVPTMPVDTAALDSMMATVQSLPSMQIGIENPQSGFDLYTGTSTFFSYVLGIQSVNLGSFTGIIVFLFWSFFTFIGIKVAFIFLPILAALVGVVKRLIQFVLDFLPF